ncbi:MAG: HAD hydrolase-like protein [Betaproteobacteria bacterium]
MHQIDTLFFDLDGTLTDNYAGITSCIIHALERQGHPAPAVSQLHACIGPPLRQNFSQLMETTDTAAIEQAIAHYRERFAVTGWLENTPYPGIHEALAVLRDAGYRMFVCTSKVQLYAERIIDHFELRTFFGAVYGPDLAGKLDDKRDLLRHALAEQQIAPGRALMIGDRAQDMRAARSNALRALGVLYGYGSPEELTGAGADALCASVERLPAAVAGLRGRNTETSS